MNGGMSNIEEKLKALSLAFWLEIDYLKCLYKHLHSFSTLFTHFTLSIM